MEDHGRGPARLLAVPERPAAAESKRDVPGAGLPDPTDPGRYTTHITFYVHSERLADAETVEFFHTIAQGFAEIIRDEDYVASASQQRSANSGALPYVFFGRNEPALHHYHNTYRAALGRDPLPLLETIDAGRTT